MKRPMSVRFYIPVWLLAMMPLAYAQGPAEFRQNRPVQPMISPTDRFAAIFQTAAMASFLSPGKARSVSMQGQSVAFSQPPEQKAGRTPRFGTGVLKFHARASVSSAIQRRPSGMEDSAGGSKNDEQPSLKDFFESLPPRLKTAFHELKQRVGIARGAAQSHRIRLAFRACYEELSDCLLAAEGSSAEESAEEGDEVLLDDGLPVNLVAFLAQFNTLNLISPRAGKRIAGWVKLSLAEGDRAILQKVNREIFFERLLNELCWSIPVAKKKDKTSTASAKKLSNRAREITLHEIRELLADDCADRLMQRQVEEDAAREEWPSDDDCCDGIGDEKGYCDADGESSSEWAFDLRELEAEADELYVKFWKWQDERGCLERLEHLMAKYPFVSLEYGLPLGSDPVALLEQLRKDASDRGFAEAFELAVARFKKCGKSYDNLVQLAQQVNELRLRERAQFRSDILVVSQKDDYRQVSISFQASSDVLSSILNARGELLDVLYKHGQLFDFEGGATTF